jgi:hypothetical protein
MASNRHVASALEPGRAVARPGDRRSAQVRLRCYFVAVVFSAPTASTISTA